MRGKSKKEENLETPRTTSSKKQRKSQNRSKQFIKLSLNLLSHTLYCPKQKITDQKIVFYDQFQSQKQDIDGAVTYRFLPHQSEGESLAKCKKVDNLSPKQQSNGKRKKDQQSQRKMSEARSKKKEKVQTHSRAKEQNLRPKLMGLAYEGDS